MGLPAPPAVDEVATRLGTTRPGLHVDPIRATAIVALALGIFLRFYHIDHKVYSGDEVYTSLRMLGASETDVVRRAARLHDAHDLWVILHPTPAQGGANAFAAVPGLALEEPQHSPMYFVLGHFWIEVFGNSIAATRALSAAISLLALPLAFFLGIELYGSRRAGWIALALAALSPVSVLYAQEAREYSLWTVALLGLSLTVLRALRIDRLSSWVLVAAMTAFSLYAYPLTLCIVVALAAYAVAVARGDGRLLRRRSLAFAAGTLVAVPWLLVMLQHMRSVLQSMATIFGGRLSPLEIGRAFAGAMRLNVFDLNFVYSSRAGFVATLLCGLLLVAAIAFVVRRMPPRISLFLLLLVLATTLPLLVADAFGGQRVRSPRYFIPAYIALDYCLVGLVYAVTVTRNKGRAAVGYALFGALLIGRATSSLASSQALTWWTKMDDNSIPIALAIDRAKEPIVVSDNILDYTFVLANYLRPEIVVELRPRCYLCSDRGPPRLDRSILPIDGHFTDVFALGPSRRLQILLRAIIAQRHLRVAYHCINTRRNCASDLNVEPVFRSQ